MTKLTHSKIFIPAAILYAVLIFYLSITSNLGNIRHQVNITLIHNIKGILIAIDIPFILNSLASSLKYFEERSIDIGHVGIYFLFGILLYFAFASSKKKVFEKYAVAFAVCMGTAYGVLNEIFQIFLPYRTASIGDAFSNLLGLILAQLLVLTFAFLLRHGKALMPVTP